MRSFCWAAAAPATSSTVVDVSINERRFMRTSQSDSYAPLTGVSRQRQAAPCDVCASRGGRRQANHRDELVPAVALHVVLPDAFALTVVAAAGALVALRPLGQIEILARDEHQALAASVLCALLFGSLGERRVRGEIEVA